MRHSAKSSHSHRDFFRWVERALPDVRSRFEFRRLPCRPLDPSRYALHASWAGDTFQYWDPQSFQRATQILNGCRSAGVPVINPVDRLANTAKSEGSRLIKAAGIRVPRMEPIDRIADFRRDLAGMQLPLLIRENRGHGQPVVLVRTPEDLHTTDLERFRNPVAVEFIDTRSPSDGYFRKYRYVVAGEVGVARHLIVSDHWEARNRIMTDACREEERAYLTTPDPNHEPLQRARRNLGLDVLGFDYSYDRDGQMVVWEANPFPDLNCPKVPWAGHVVPAVERSFAALARLYLQRSGLPVPAKIDQLLARPISAN